MGIFDLRGPEFLLLYAVVSLCGLVVFGVVTVWVNSPWVPEDEEAERTLHPYALALLAGGRSRVIEAVLAALVANQYLEVRGLNVHVLEPPASPRKAAVGGTAYRVDARAPSDGLNPLERAMLDDLRRQGPSGMPAITTRLSNVVDRMKPALRDVGLWVRDSRTQSAIALVAISGLCILGLGAVKVSIGMSRGRPVSFLVMAMGAVGLATAFGMFWLWSLDRPTRRGTALGRERQRELAGLRTTAEANPGLLTAQDAALAVATFGGTVLLGSALAHALLTEQRIERERKAAAAAASSGDSGSSCSSCSSCSGCGGGGGCGGCS
ncbi:MAG: TIGR04222 domain-containing membrane protein [Sandaracinaceae bacterium]